MLVSQRSGPDGTRGSLGGPISTSSPRCSSPAVRSPASTRSRGAVEGTRRRNAHVRAWREDSGNMGLAAREMPSADGLIAWQNIERRALDLHAAGMDGTAGQLQVQAMLDSPAPPPARVLARTRTGHDGE